MGIWEGMSIMSSTKRKVFCALLLLAGLALLVIYLCDNLKVLLNYRFFAIRDLPFFWGNILLLALAVVLYVLLVFALLKGRSVWLRFAAVAVYTVYLFASAFFLLAGQASSPPTCSYTEDPDHFGIYDEAVALAKNKEKLGFPSEIPSEATDVRYVYTYWYGESNHSWIMAAWTLPDEAFDRELRRLRADDFQIEEGVETYRKTAPHSALLGGSWVDMESPFSDVLIFVDWSAHRIACLTTYASEDAALFPVSMDDLPRFVEQLRPR